MNRKRVVMFVILLALGGVVVRLPFGLLRGYLRHMSGGVARWMAMFETLVVACTFVATAAFLGYLQRERLAMHAVAVVLGMSLISLVTITLQRLPVLLWFVDISTLILLVAIGVSVGLFVRRLGERRAAQ